MSLHRWAAWFDRRLTASGQLVLLCLASGAIFGVNTRASTAYLLAAICAALLLVSLIGSWRRPVRLELDRLLPAFGAVGETSYYTVRARNLRAQAVSEVLLEEQLQPPSSLGPLDAGRFWRASATVDRSGAILDPAWNEFDRRVGFPRFQQLMRWRAGARTPRTKIARIAAKSMVTCDASLEFLRRGKIEFAALRVLVLDPLGLVRSARRVELADEILVLPQRCVVPDWLRVTVSQRTVDGDGGTQSRGSGQELASVRPYRPRDPLRHIDWRGFARVGEPLVKEFDELRSSPSVLFVDALTDDEGGFEAMLSIAFSLCVPISGRATIDKLLLGTEYFSVAEGKADRARAAVLRAFALAQAADAQDSGALERQLDALNRRAAHSASQLFWLSCEWDASRERQRQALVRRGLQVRLLAVTERAFNGASDEVQQAPGLARQMKNVNLVELGAQS